MTRILVAATLLGSAVAAAAGMASWLVGPPEVHFVSCWVTQFRDPSIPPNTAADQDRLAILRGRFFAKADVASMPVHSRFLIQQQLSSLAQESDSASVVVYVSTYSTVDRDGHVILLTSDFDPGNCASGLPLASLLNSLAKSPAKHKLLVLDIFQPCVQPGLSSAVPNVAASIPGELASVRDPQRLVLCSCSPGQSALVSEAMQRTVFGYYFEQALCGAADGHNADGLRDGRVSVSELAGSVRARVDRWAIHNAGCRQTPQLVGTGEDFELSACSGTTVVALAEDKLAKYPAWLLDGWKLRDRWLQDDTARFAPRILRTLQASLLRIETKWRLGAPAQQLQTECQDTLADLQRLVAVALQQLAGPTPSSLAAVQAAGHAINPQADEAVTQLLESIKAASTLKPDQQQSAVQKSFADFDKQSKDVSDIDIALSLLHAAISGEPLSIDRLQALTQALQHRSIGDQWIETRAIGRLASKAQHNPPALWPTGCASQLLRIIQQNEQVSCHYETMPWMSHLLEATAQASHDAEFYFWSDQYVPGNTLDDAISAAVNACDRMAAHEEVLVRANRVYDASMLTLPWYALYASRAPQSTADWNPAVDATVLLGQLLEAEPPPNGMSKQQLEAIQRATSDTQSALEAVQQPVSSHTVQQLIRRCTGENVPPSAAAEADAVLATPLLTADERVALWTARAQLALRRQSQTWQWDHEEDVQGHITATLAGYDPDTAMRTATSISIRRYRISRDLLRLGGFPVSSMPADLPEKDQISVSPQNIAAMAQAWNTTLPTAIRDHPQLTGQDRLSRIFPPLKPLPLLDQPDTNPTIRLIAGRRRQLWSWLGSRYHYRAQDGPDSQYYASLAVEYAPYATEKITPSLQTNGPTRLTDITGPGSQTTCVTAWATNLPTDSKTPVRIDILNPADPWLGVVAQPDSIGNCPTSPLRLTVSLAAGAAFSGIPPQGFLICWHVAGRTFHRPIDVPALADQCDLDVLLSPVLVNPGAGCPQDTLDQIPVRPNAGPQSLYLYIRNRGLQSRKVEITVSSEPVTVCPLEIGAGEVAAAKFPPPAAAPGDGNRGAEAKGLPPLIGPLTISLADAVSHKQLKTASFPVRLLEPRQYVAAGRASFVPLSDTHNRLEIELRRQAEIAGPPCQVNLDVTAAQVPGLMGLGDGVLQGALPADGQPLKLFARNLHLADGASEQGSFSLTVDGVPRAFVFDATFARGGDPTTPTEAIRPALRISAPTTGRSGDPLAVRIETDYAPESATLEILLGQQREQGEFACERRQELSGGRQRRIGFSPAGKNGALLFDASISDWNVSLDTAGIVGHRIIKVRMLTADSREIAVAQREIVLGNQPPQGVQFVQVPTEAWNGKPLDIAVAVRQSVPEVNHVVFFLGKPAGNTIPKDTAAVEATAADAEGKTWSAQLPLKKSNKGETLVSVQCTNAAGLSTFATTTVNLTDVQISGASIHGLVMEGKIPQSGIEVVLKDEQGGAKGKATTAADGSFTFENLKPGKYQAAANKPTSGRHGTASVLVKENTTTQVTIALWL